MHAFVYSDEYQRYDYGPQHPLKLRRLKLTHDLISSYGLLERDDVSLLRSEPAHPEEAMVFHSPDYLAFLDEADRGAAAEIDASRAALFNLGFGDNPLFPGVYRWALLCVGASLQAARLLAAGSARVAFNICGGMHHAMPHYASGFCYLNDPVIAILELRRHGLRVAYLDLDAHHGDGVEYAFRSSAEVLTISLHESGQYLFPGGGHETDIGSGAGKGYAINVPLYPESDDTLFLRAFSEVAEPLIERFKPDVLVTQLGVDTFRTDPLAHLNLTTEGFTEVLRHLPRLAPRWLALGGGGYNVFNVARAWTLAWAVMLGVEPDDAIPARFLAGLPGEEAARLKRLRDAPFSLPGAHAQVPAKHLARVIRWIRETVFPLHGLRP